jgi:hypothetical protein
MTVPNRNHGVPASASSSRARVGSGTGAVARLVVARLSRRRGAASLVVLAVAATIVVVGGLLGVGVTSADRAVETSLTGLTKAHRAISLYRTTEVEFDEAAADALARKRLEPVLQYTDPILATTFFPFLERSISLLAVDDPAGTIGLTSGRIPARCVAGTTCEAALIGREFFPDDQELQAGSIVQLGTMPLRLVGTVDIDPTAPLAVPSQRGPVLVVIGASGLLADPRTADQPRTTTWLAALDPVKVHVWEVPDIAAAVTTIRQELSLEDASFWVVSPDATFEEISAAAATSAGRITFIGSLIVAVLLAFAIFAATIERQDVREEYRRLRARGATATQLLAFVLIEAALPALLGVLIGVVGAAGLVALIAQQQGAPPGPAIGASILEPAALALILGLAGVAIVAVALGLHPASGRFVRLRLIVLAAAPALAVLVWQQLERGALDASALAAGAAGPGTVLLPGMLGLAVILASLGVLPPIFRRIARGSTRAPLPLRLAWLSIAREPLRPAATMTLLAFSVGSAIFGLGYAATLRQSAADVAAFTAGMDVLVTAPESSTPFARAALPRLRGDAERLGVEIHPSVEIPTLTAVGTNISLLGLEPEAIRRLRGWRPDFSTLTSQALADAISMPGDWQLAGQLLPDGTRELVLEIELKGDPMRVTAVVQAADGSHRIRYFDELEPGRHTLREPLSDPAELAALSPGEPSGWRLIGLAFERGGPGFDVETGHAEVTIQGAEGIADPAVPIEIDVSSRNRTQVVRAPSRSDGLALPAIVSPDIAAEAGGEGEVVIEIPTGQLLRIRPVAIATLFPTLTDRTRGFVVVDEGPLLNSLDAFAPGFAEPNEALVRTSDDATAEALVATLSEPPYPTLFLASRPALERAATEDPFAVGIVLTLLLGAVAGLALAIAGILIGTASDLRDDRGELGELEEQGVGPAALGRLAVVRATTLVALGTVVGAIVGLGLTWFASTAIAVTAAGVSPMPPIVTVVPALAIALVAGGLVGGLAVAVAVLARRHFGGRLLREAGSR